jgi:glutaredoxin 3
VLLGIEVRIGGGAVGKAAVQGGLPVTPIVAGHGNSLGRAGATEVRGTMPSVEIYTTPTCPYCHRAKALLTRKGVAFREIDVTSEPGARDEMSKRTNGGRTVPQILIEGRPVGGSDDLAALDRKGELDHLLGLDGG